MITEPHCLESDCTEPSCVAHMKFLAPMNHPDHGTVVTYLMTLTDDKKAVERMAYSIVQTFMDRTRADNPEEFLNSLDETMERNIKIVDIVNETVGEAYSIGVSDSSPRKRVHDLGKTTNAAVDRILEALE